MESVDDHSNREQKDSGCRWSACEEFDHSSTTCKKHRSHENISKATEDNEHGMCCRSISGFHNLEESVSIGSSPFQFNGECCEENDLNTSASSVPQCARDTVSIGESS